MTDHKEYDPVGQVDEEEGLEDVPVAAAKVAPFDGVTDDPEDFLKVRVIAPMGLPPRYKLFVKTTSDGEPFEVRVPETGAAFGEEFIATIVQPKPVEGHFSSDVCACGSEGEFCMVAWCCQGLELRPL